MTEATSSSITSKARVREIIAEHELKRFLAGEVTLEPAAKKPKPLHYSNFCCSNNSVEWYQDFPWSTRKVPWNKRKHSITGEYIEIQGTGIAGHYIPPLSEYPPKFLAWFDTKPWYRSTTKGDTVRHNFELGVTIERPFGKQPPKGIRYYRNEMVKHVEAWLHGGAPSPLFNTQRASAAMKKQRDAWRSADPPRSLHPDTLYTEEAKRPWYDQHPWGHPTNMDLHPLERNNDPWGHPTNMDLHPFERYNVEVGGKNPTLPTWLWGSQSYWKHTKHPIPWNDKPIVIRELWYLLYSEEEERDLPWYDKYPFTKFRKVPEDLSPSERYNVLNGNLCSPPELKASSPPKSESPSAHPCHPPEIEKFLQGPPPTTSFLKIHDVAYDWYNRYPWAKIYCPIGRCSYDPCRRVNIVNNNVVYPPELNGPTYWKYWNDKVERCDGEEGHTGSRYVTPIMAGWMFDIDKEYYKIQLSSQM